jgi:hypothetical protein
MLLQRNGLSLSDRELFIQGNRALLEALSPGIESASVLDWHGATDEVGPSDF